jgi:anti-sigma-K factor RskA
MNYDNAELLEQLAAEYVLGTLHGAARRRFARVCERLPAASAARARWEDRLAALALALEPVQPRDSIWQGIVRQVTASKVTPIGSRQRLRPRQWLPLAAAAALFGIAVWLGPRWLSPSVQVVAVLGADVEHPQWRIERTANAHRLHATALSAMTSSPQRAFELWALPPGGKAPVSLGLLPRDGKASYDLSAVQSAAVLAAVNLAVSVEPAGGSPTGAPTGPVIMVAAVKISS